MSYIPPDQQSPYGIAQRAPRTKYADAGDAGDSGPFLTAAQLRARYGGVSDMWIWRRLRDGSRFPQPIEIARRRYWRLAALIAWENGRAGTSEAAP